MNPKDILLELRVIRKADGKSQLEVSEYLGQNSQTIVSRYENGINSPTLNTLCKWVDALDCEIVIQKKEK